MTSFDLRFGDYVIADDRVPVPDNLKGKDVRADVTARMAVLCASTLLDSQSDIDLTSLNVIVVNREGCRSHIAKVTAGIEKRAPSQGFFARGGPQTLATYTALAIGCHGCALTIVGDDNALEVAIPTALSMTGAHPRSSTILTAVVRDNTNGLQAKSVLIRATPAPADSPPQDDCAKERIGDYLGPLLHTEH